MKRMQSFFMNADIRPLELFMSGVMLMWGIFVISPFWDAFTSSSSYRIINIIGGGEPRSEFVWGILAITASVMKIISVIKGYHLLQTYALIVKTFIWLCLAGSIFVANPQGLGVPVYGMFALANMFILIFRGME